MYTRTIRLPPERIVQNGLPVFGDFYPPPLRLDIRKLKQPFSIMPLPAFITQQRIRANLCFSFVTEDYAGTVEILDANWFGFIELNLWERKTKRKLPYRRLMLRRNFVPYTLYQGVCASHSKKRYFKIRWNYNAKTFSVLCRLKGDKERPDIFFAFSNEKPDKPWCSLTSVIPAPTMRRCAATHHAALPLKGSFSASINTKSAALNSSISEALGLFSIRRAYYKLRLQCCSLTVMGRLDGKSIQFTLYTSNQAPPDSDTYNENVLFVQGETIPFPPVTITRPYGLQGQWIIQDTESMIDLSFFPEVDTLRKKSILVLRTEYHTFYGKCEGNIRGKNGELFVLKDFSAIAKKQYLRL